MLEWACSGIHHAVIVHAFMVLLRLVHGSTCKAISVSLNMDAKENGGSGFQLLTDMQRAGSQLSISHRVTQHCCCRTTEAVQAALIDELLEIMPKSLTRFAFQNSGSESVENAIKIARAHTKRKGIIAFEVRSFWTHVLVNKGSAGAGHACHGHLLQHAPKRGQVGCTVPLLKLSHNHSM